MERKNNQFKSARWNKRVFTTLQIILGVTLFMGLNALASKYFIRKDMTEARLFSLSPETEAYLKKLKKPVTIYVTIPPYSSQRESNEVYQHVHSLLREYEYATRNSGEAKVSVEFINPYEQSAKAQEIANRFGTQKENAIIISCGERHRHIPGTDLYNFRNSEVEAFKGEQAFTSAILDVTRENQDVVYFLSGHGEMRFNDVDPLRGLSQASSTLLNHNLKVKQLDLSQTASVPEDASILVIAAPQAPLLPEEANHIANYINKQNGALVVFLDPGAQSGLEPVLEDWGIIADDMLLLDTHSNANLSGGDTILRTFAEHDITQFLIDYQLTILSGLTRPVRPDPTASNSRHQKTTALIASSDQSWAIFDYGNPEKTDVNPHTDLKGPVPIATISERNARSQLGISIPGGRLIVFGNSDLISNNRLNSLGNAVLFQNTISWCLERSELLNLPPRRLTKFQLPLSKNDLSHLAMGLSIIPLAITALGIFIYSIRKH